MSKYHYIKLLKRLQRLDMIEFWPPEKVRIRNGIKCVSKPNGTQRLIFDGRPANLVLHPPMKVILPAFHLTALWSVAEDEFLAYGKIDIDNYYHRLGIPDWMKSVLGLPEIPAADVGEQGKLVIPVCRTLPMGLSHSVLLAQRAHLQLLQQFSAYHLINVVVDPAASIWILLYIDDVIIAAKDTSAERAQEKVNTLIHEMLYWYAQQHIMVNQEKVVFAQSTVIGLGCELSGITKSIIPRTHHMQQLVSATKYLLQCEAINKKGLEKLLGHWIWFLLLRRPLFSILFHIYRLLAVTNDHCTAPLWLSVKRELALLVLFSDIIALKWTRGNASEILATDASGLGASACLRHIAYEPPTYTSFGKAAEERFSHERWQPTIMRRWDFPEHINILEGRALCLSLLAQIPRVPIQHTNIQVFSDNLVLCGAVHKGRSSSYHLCCILRRLLAFSLLFDVNLMLTWIASHSNPADCLSRLSLSNSPSSLHQVDVRFGTSNSTAIRQDDNQLHSTSSRLDA